MSRDQVPHRVVEVKRNCDRHHAYGDTEDPVKNACALHKYIPAGKSGRYFGRALEIGNSDSSSAKRERAEVPAAIFRLPRFSHNRDVEFAFDRP
jgi:hypothetical protein